MYIKGSKLRQVIRALNGSCVLSMPLMLCFSPGLFLSMMCVFLGMNNFQIGLVNAIPNCALLGQLLAAFLISKIGHRKRYHLTFNIIFRSSALGMALLLFFHTLAGGQVSNLGLFLALFFVFHFFCAMQTPLWFSWIGDILPDREVNSFWGVRNMLVFVASLLASLVLGYALDLQEKLPWVMALTCVLGAFLALSELIVYWKLPSMENPSPQKVSIPTILKEAFSNANFRCLLGFTTFFHFGVFLMIPFFFLHLKNLGLSSLNVQIICALGSLGAMAGSIFWSRLGRIVSNKQALMLSMILKLMGWVVFMLIGTNTPHYILAIYLTYDGFLNGGVLTSIFAMLTAETPKSNRSVYTAIYFSVQGVSSFVAASLSGLVFAYLQQFPYVFFGHTFMPYHALFAVLFIFTPLALFFLKDYSTERSLSTWGTMLIFLDGSPFLSFLKLTNLAGRSSFQNRYHFITNNRSRLFVPELIEAVNDPSRIVREAAVKSLGAIKDTRSEQELMRVLLSDESGLRHLAAESLGNLQSTEAINLLLKYIDHPGPVLRKAVICALAQIGSPLALPLLKKRLNDEPDVAVAAELADALASFEDVESIDAIFNRLRQVKELGLRMQFGVALANLMGQVGEFYPLLAEESHSPGSVRSDFIKTIRKKVLENAEWLEALQDSFDEEKYHQVLEICLVRGVMFLNTIESSHADHSNDEKAHPFADVMPKLLALDQAKHSRDRRLWLLSAMNNQADTTVRFEEAMLAMYILVLIYRTEEP